MGKFISIIAAILVCVFVVTKIVMLFTGGMNKSESIAFYFGALAEKIQIEEFDHATVNVKTNEYDEVKNNLKQQIINRYNNLKNTAVDWEEFQFNEYWDRVVDKHFDPHIINNILDQIGIQKEDKFIDFMTLPT